MSDSSSIESLVASLRFEISQRAPGERLPSNRQLMQRFGVSPVTVARAVSRLAAQGIVVTRPGSGTFVAQRFGRDIKSSDTSWQAVALADRGLDAHTVTDLLGPPPDRGITMAGGYLHRSLQPTKALGAALARAARRPDAWDRAPTAGLEALRALFARLAGAGVDSRDVLVTSGGQDGLSMAFRAIAAPGSPVLVESPTYRGALAAARAAGLRAIPVPVDSDGVRPELLADAFAMSGARLFYCQPTFHNPTGAVLSAQRRTQVLDIARAAGAFVLEDDFARLLGHGARVPAPLLAADRDGTVVHLTSLTKPASPSLRLGALIARGPVMHRLTALRLVDDFFLSRPLQEAAVELLTGASWDRHLRWLSAALRERCATMTAAIARHIPDWTVPNIPGGGLHLWVETPNEQHDRADCGVTVSDGRGHFAAEPAGSFLRLSFAAPADLTDIRQGITLLAPS